MKITTFWKRIPTYQQYPQYAQRKKKKQKERNYYYGIISGFYYGIYFTLEGKRNQRIDSGSVWHLVKKYLKQAQIEKDKLSPHTLRHTFATTLLKNGENILTIKELLSHRNLRTTERYLHINGDDLKSAVGKINLTIA